MLNSLVPRLVLSKAYVCSKGRAWERGYNYVERIMLLLLVHIVAMQYSTCFTGLVAYQCLNQPHR